MKSIAPPCHSRMLFSGIHFLLSMAVLAHADVFKTAQDNTVLNAASKDARGDYYRWGEDYRFSSNLNRQSYDFNGGNGGAIPDQYGSFDLNTALEKYLSSKGFANRASDMVDDVNSKQSLMFLQYSSPAEADLLKHFHTTALLKMGIRSQQYAQLQNHSKDSMYELAARSKFKCVNDYLNETAGRSIDQAFESCRREAVFKSLVGRTRVTNGVLRNALWYVAVRGDDANPIISITGDVSLSNSNYVFDGPLNRAGKVLQETRGDNVAKIAQLVQGYLEDRHVDSVDLKALSLPGLELQAYQIRHLAMLEEDRRSIAVAKLASRLAYVKTVQQYNMADEYLRRTLESPNVEGVYKDFIRERRQFLKEEIASLSTQKEFLRDYAQTSVSLIDEADAKRQKIIAQMEQ